MSHLIENNGRVLYVSTTGNDATAQIGNPEKPWRTPWAAHSAASSGDLIHVHKGTYSVGTTGRGSDFEYADISEALMVRDGETMSYYLDEARLEFNIGATNTVFCNDFINGTIQQWTVNFYGTGTIVNNGTGQLRLVFCRNRTTSSLCKFNATFEEMLGVNGSIVNTFPPSTYLKVRRGLNLVSRTSNHSINTAETPSIKLDYGFLEDTFGNAIFFFQGSDQTYEEANIDIKIGSFYGRNGQATLFRYAFDFDINNCNLKVEVDNVNFHGTGYDFATNTPSYFDPYLIDTSQIEGALVSGAIEANMFNSSFNFTFHNVVTDGPIAHIGVNSLVALMDTSKIIVNCPNAIVRETRAFGAEGPLNMDNSTIRFQGNVYCFNGVCTATVDSMNGAYDAASVEFSGKFKGLTQIVGIDAAVDDNIVSLEDLTMISTDGAPSVAVNTDAIAPISVITKNAYANSTGTSVNITETGEAINRITTLI
jgi:hypothetical protein